MSSPNEEYVFDTKHDRYPVAVHAILSAPDRRILLMRRTGSIDAEGLLALPAGHVDLGETPTESLIRELNEELGITLTPAQLTPAGVMGCGPGSLGMSRRRGCPARHHRWRSRIRPCRTVAPRRRRPG
jgi:8-oxo-dGTP pyrophosphatase MutT (NUDIX family)